MKIFKAEQWNIEVLAPLFEAYRLANGMSENPDRTLTFLTNRIRFNESMFFVAVNENSQAIGFIQLLSSLILFTTTTLLAINRYFCKRRQTSSRDLCCPYF